MKTLFTIFSLQLLFLITSGAPSSTTKAGFYMPDSVQEVTLRYRNVMNLIILPVTINDSIHVNLVLDTGCRNLVLFGKRFSKLFELEPGKKIQFSGLGSGDPVTGDLSLGNRVSIREVAGERIPVVIVPNQNIFDSRSRIDGVIGYDILIKFEVELNITEQLITFRPAFEAELRADYTRIAIRIEDSRPIINSTVFFYGRDGQVCDMMIDTGSCLGLLVKTSDVGKYPPGIWTNALGRGLNGRIEGIRAMTEKIMLEDLEIKKLQVGIIYSPWHNYASVGMEVIKEYSSIVLNYCKAYAGFKKA